MKKFSVTLMIAIIIIGVFVLGFGYKASPEPNNFYEVYLDDKSLGTIASKEDLENYIDENGSYYKNKFDVDKVYSPKGLQIKKLTPYEYSMLFARLMYPSYYFDLYESIMNNDESEEKLVPIIAKTEEFELFLKEAYLEISKYAPLDKINWLIY